LNCEVFNIKKLILSIIIFTILICIFFIPTLNQINSIQKPEIILDFNSGIFQWPIPGFTKISSYFGKRNAPTSGAAIYHTGIDIPAPEGTKLVAICDGTITFTDFLGGGGYTITLSVDATKFTYCHVSPNFIVDVGDVVSKGQVIGYVGPKYVYGVKGNQYSDNDGKPTNGATTGCHLHFGIRVFEKYVNPLDYFKSSNIEKK
jgi:murein DD-endopeptidase MepM/ murein hydrolase activator NlpD